MFKRGNKFYREILLPFFSVTVWAERLAAEVWHLEGLEVGREIWDRKCVDLDLYTEDWLRVKYSPTP